MNIISIHKIINSDVGIKILHFEWDEKKYALNKSYPLQKNLFYKDTKIETKLLVLNFFLKITILNAKESISKLKIN